MDLVSNVIALAKLHVRENEIKWKLDSINAITKLLEEDEHLKKSILELKIEPNQSIKVEQNDPAEQQPPDGAPNDIRKAKIKAKLKKRKQKKIRMQKLRNEIEIYEKKANDRNLMKSQILEELTNEFPDLNLKMAEPVRKVNPCLFGSGDSIHNARVNEQIKKEEVDYYRLPPPPPPPGLPGKHLPQPVEKNPQKDVFRYFHYNRILESYEITDSRIPPKHIRK